MPAKDYQDLVGEANNCFKEEIPSYSRWLDGWLRRKTESWIQDQIETQPTRRRLAELLKILKQAEKTEKETSKTWATK
jgi:hypothetical protein